MSLFRKPNKSAVTCVGAREMMFDYLDGQLSADESARLANHLNECAECRAELEQCKRTLNLIQSTEFTVPDKLYGNVMNLVGVTLQEKRKFLKGRIRYIPFGTIAAACAVAVLVLLNRSYVGNLFSADMAGEAMSYDETENYTADDMIKAEFKSDSSADTFADESKETGLERGSFYTANEVLTGNSSDEGSDAESADENIYYESTAVLTYAPHLSENDYDESALLADFLAEITSDYSEYPIIVCYDGAINISDVGDGVVTNDYNGETCLLYMITEENTETVLTVYENYITLLRDDGEDYETYMPEDGSYDSFLIFIVDYTDNNEEVTEQPD